MCPLAMSHIWSQRKSQWGCGCLPSSNICYQIDPLIGGETVEGAAAEAWWHVVTWSMISHFCCWGDKSRCKATSVQTNEKVQRRGGNVLQESALLFYNKVWWHNATTNCTTISDAMCNLQSGKQLAVTLFQMVSPGRDLKWWMEWRRCVWRHNLFWHHFTFWCSKQLNSYTGLLKSKKLHY